jgi:hypothetical protein
MQRRSFLTGLGTLLGGVILEQAIPLNRVWSFPKEIKIVRDPLAIYERDADGIRVAENWITVRHLAWECRPGGWVSVPYPNGDTV